MNSRIIVIVDDDPLLGMTIARQIEAANRRIILCANIESAMAVIERWQVSLLLTDIRLTTPFGWEGLELVRRVHEQRPLVTVVAMTGMVHPDLQTELLDRGARAVLQKPFEIEDLEIIIEGSAAVSIPSELEQTALILQFPSHDTVMSAKGMGRLFQPIVDISDEAFLIHGVEALTRHRQEDPLSDIGVVLRYASLAGRGAELDLKLVEHSMQDAEPLAGRTLIFVNLHPHTLSRPESVVGLIRRTAKGGFPVESLVLEITENVEIRDRASTLDCIAGLQGLGVRFALDDVGASFSHRWLLETQKPAYVKIGHELGTGFEGDPMKERIVRDIHHLAFNFGVPTILEGIETKATMDAARQIGIPFGQGYHIGKPELSWTVAASFLDAA